MVEHLALYNKPEALVPCLQARRAQLMRPTDAPN
jgi:hypothetical protein